MARKKQSNYLLELSIEPIPLITLRGRRGGPLPAFMNVEVLEAILRALRKGAWDYNACEVAGVPKSTFEEWMRRGRADRQAGRDTEFSRFSGQVERAKALARMEREIHVARRNPLAWLTKGPGRERPGRPGWGTRTAENSFSDGPIHVTFDIERASGGVGLSRENAASKLRTE